MQNSESFPAPASPDIVHCNEYLADPDGRTVYGVHLRLTACWEGGFGSRRGHGYLSVVIVVC